MTLAKTTTEKGGTEMNHDEYWKKAMNRSEKTLCGLFEGSRTRVRDIVAELGVEIDATDAARFFDGL